MWPGRRRPRPQSGRSRRRAPSRVDRIALSDLTPDPVALLGRLAYLRLALFEAASGVAGRATDLADREAVTKVAAALLDQHTAILKLIETHDAVPTDAMRPYAADIDRYRRRLSDPGWHESVLTLHLAVALLDDFFAAFASGLPGAEGERVAGILETDPGHDALVAILQAGIKSDRRVASRLALWGRRLVGDTLLVARSALADARDGDGQPTETDERRVEPILNDLMARHSRRMDRLGLTA